MKIKRTRDGYCIPCITHNKDAEQLVCTKIEGQQAFITGHSGKYRLLTWNTLPKHGRRRLLAEKTLAALELQQAGELIK